MLHRCLVRDYKTHPHRSEAMIHPVADLSTHQRDHHLVARPYIALEDEKTEENGLETHFDGLRNLGARPPTAPKLRRRRTDPSEGIDALQQENVKGLRMTRFTPVQ